MVNWDETRIEIISKLFALSTFQQRFYIYLYSSKCTTFLVIYMLSLFFAASQKYYVFLQIHIMVLFFLKVKPTFFEKNIVSYDHVKI